MTKSEIRRRIKALASRACSLRAAIEELMDEVQDESYEHEESEWYDDVHDELENIECNAESVENDLDGMDY